MEIRTVCRTLECGGQFRDADSKDRLDGFQYGLVFLRADKGDGKTLGAKSASAADLVEILVGICGHVVIDHDIHALDVDASTKETSHHHESRLEGLEGLVAFDSKKYHY